MNFFELAWNNVRRKFSSYMIYLVSTIFAVTIFSIFCSLYYNPQFSQYRFGVGKMSTLFKASAIAVILFSSVFVVYANKFFVKTRKKEIAIYSLLGMKKSQIGRMLFYENIFMGILAIVCGVLLGTLFSRFFAMILSGLMSSRVKVGFSIRIEAVITTVVAFFILFVINSFNAYAIIYRYRLIELLSAGKEGEKTPRYSALGGMVSILMIAAGYVISQVMDVNKGGLKLLLPSFLILFLVVTGTILLFQNFIPMVLFKLKQNENFYFKPANYISLSQIVYRIRANSRILSVIAVLSAATITIAGSTYSMYTSFEASWKYYSPFSYMCFNADELQYKDMLDTIKKVHEVKVASTNRFQLIKVQGSCPGYSLVTDDKPGMVFSAYVISQSDYKSIIRNTRVPFGGLSNIKANFKENLSDNECFFIDGNTDPRYCEKLPGKTADIRSGSQVCRYEISGVSLHKYIGIFDLYQMPTFVVNDTIFSGFLAKADKENIVGVTGLIFNKFNGWDKTNDALDKVAPVHTKALNMMGMANFSVINITRSIYSMYGAYVFIGMFLGILFLLASGSIMYYKQIIEAQEEVERYEILKKTGMSWKEAKQSIVRQLGIIFGIPLTVGLLHTFFAVLTYNRTMDLSGKEMPLVANAFLIVVVYIVIYCFYYGLSVKSYMKIAWREKTA